MKNFITDHRARPLQPHERLQQCLNSTDFQHTVSFVEGKVDGKPYGYHPIMCDSIFTANKFYDALKLSFKKDNTISFNHFSVGCSGVASKSGIESIDLKKFSLATKHAKDDRTKAISEKKQVWFMLCPSRKDTNFWQLSKAELSKMKSEMTDIESKEKADTAKAITAAKKLFSQKLFRTSNVSTALILQNCFVL